MILILINSLRASNMKKHCLFFSLLFGLLCSVPILTQANARLLKSNTIQAKAISGVYPSLVAKDYQNVNRQIKDFIYQDLAKRAKILDNGFGFNAIQVDYQYISTHKNTLNFMIHYEISDLTSRYFTKYYSIDLKNKKQIRLKDYLKQHNSNIQKINHALNRFIQPCRKSKKPDYCNEMSLSYLLNQNTQLKLQNHDSFYIRDANHIRIGFNSSKFTTTFDVNIRNYRVSF